jgi:hypothetical protein
MTVMVLLISGISITIVAAYVAATRVYGVVAEPVLAGETTAVGLADPSSETMGERSGSASSLQTDWNLTTVSALSDAEEMLDYLEAQGYSERELMVLGNSCFAVRWR